LDEKPVTLHADVRPPSPAIPGQEALGGHLKSGQLGSPQNRPVERVPGQEML
jgi:hypothetical protein